MSNSAHNAQRSPSKLRSSSSLHFNHVFNNQSRTPSTRVTINHRKFNPLKSDPSDDMSDVSIDSVDVAQFERLRSKAVGAYGEQKRNGDTAGRTTTLNNLSNLSLFPTAAGNKIGDGLVFSPDALVNNRMNQSAPYATDDRAVTRYPKTDTGDQQKINHHSQGVVAFQEANEYSSLISSENEWLRRKIRSISNEYEDTVDALELKVEHMIQANKKLQRRLRKECPSLNGITLAQLHHSNERLSAQLSKLEVLESAQENADKVKECESAICSLTEELDRIEYKMKVQISNHENEKRELRKIIDTQVLEFKVKKEECEKKVRTISEKFDALLKENAMLKERVSKQHESSTTFQQNQQSAQYGHKNRNTDIF